MMLCSECSNEVRPIVAVDIDGTLADYHTAFQLFVTRYFGHETNRMRRSMWDGAGEFEDFLDISKAQYREAKLAYRQGGNKRWALMYYGADKFVRDIRAMGADVWLTTQRPWLRLDNIDPDTRFWLESKSIDYEGLLYDEDKYGRLCELVDPARIVSVVDDLSEMLTRASQLDLPTWQVTRDHNEHHTVRWIRRGDLSEAAAWIKKRIETWQVTTVRNRHTSTPTR